MDVGRWGHFPIAQDRTGGQIAVSTFTKSAFIWTIPSLPLPAPEWLPRLAEALAGKRFTSDNAEVAVPPSALLALKTKLIHAKGDDPWSRWGQWFFADRATRAISPDSPAVIPQHVERCLAHNSMRSLREALALAPTNALVLARLARLALAETNNPWRLAEAEFLSSRALRLDAESAEARRIRNEVLEAISTAQ
jgi:hypothetical protein